MHAGGASHGVRLLAPHMTPAVAFTKLSWTMSAKCYCQWEQAEGLVPPNDGCEWTCTAASLRQESDTKSVSIAWIL